MRTVADASEGEAVESEMGKTSAAEEHIEDEATFMVAEPGCSTGAGSGCEASKEVEEAVTGGGATRSGNELEEQEETHEKKVKTLGLVFAELQKLKEMISGAMSEKVLKKLDIVNVMA